MNPPEHEEDETDDQRQFRKDYRLMVRAFDNNISGFFESLDSVVTDLVMDNKIPLVHDKLVEKVFDETQQDLRYKQLVKQTFVTALDEVQRGQNVKLTVGNLPRDAVQVMKFWCDQHHDAPYPTEAEKLWLSKETGLSTVQISQWFSNYRKRVWKPSQNSGSD